MIETIVTFAVYLLFVIALGLYLSRRAKTYEDFIIGGRTIGPIASSLSLVGSYASGYTYTAAPGLGYTQGYGALWWASSDAPGTAFSFGILGRRIRKASELYNAISIPEFYERRFKSPALRVVTAIILIITVGTYLVAQWVASGVLLSVTFNIDYLWGMVIAAVVVVAYTTLGGYLAVIYTDAMQMIVMFIGSQILFWAALMQVGGFGGLNDALAQQDPDLVTPWGPGNMYLGLFLVLTPLLTIFLGALGLPHLTVRHLSLNKPRSARKAMLFTAIFVVCFSFIYYMTGPLALAIIGPDHDPEQVGALLWHAVLPPVLVGLLIAAAVASIQSTASSFLILLVTTISHDLLYRFAGRWFTNQKRRTGIARIIVLVMSVVTFIIAINPPGLVFEIVIFNFGILALGFAIPNLFSLFWRRTTKAGVFSSMIASVCVYVLLEVTGFAIVGLSPILVGLIVGVVLIVVVSLLTTAPEGSIVAVIEEASSYRELSPEVVAAISAEFSQEIDDTIRSSRRASED